MGLIREWSRKDGPDTRPASKQRSDTKGAGSNTTRAARLPVSHSSPFPTVRFWAFHQQYLLPPQTRAVQQAEEVAGVLTAGSISPYCAMPLLFDVRPVLSYVISGTDLGFLLPVVTSAVAVTVASTVATVAVSESQSSIHRHPLQKLTISG
eukprot:1850221-Rhodomonas_salina.1